MAGYIGSKTSVTVISPQTDSRYVNVTGDTMTADGATVLTVDRATSDGPIIDLQKDGSSVGSIGTASSVINFLGSGGNGIQMGSGTVLGPADTSGANDATINLGASNNRFKDLYLSGGVYLGGTGSANYLDDYEEGTWTPTFTNTGTATLQYARYVKIGNTVSFWVRVGFASGVSANSSYFSMPFASTTMSSGTWTRGTIEGGFVEPQVGTSCYFSSAPSGYSGLFIITATYSTQ